MNLPKNLYLNLLLVIVICLRNTFIRAQPPPNDGQLVTGATLTTSNSSNFNGERAVDIGELIRFNYTISINASHPSSVQLKVEITLPYKETTLESGCKTFLDSGTKCTSTTTNKVSALDMAILEKSLVVLIAGVKVQSQVLTKNDYQIMYDFGSVSLDQQASVANPEIDIFFESNFTEDAEKTNINPFNLYAVTRVKGSGNPETTFNASAAFYLLRPILRIAPSASPSVLTSLTNSTITVVIDHHSESTSAAQNVSVSISLDLNDVATYDNNAGVRYNSPSTLDPVPDLKNAFQLSNFDTISTMTFIWTLTAVKLPPLQLSAWAIIRVTYNKPGGQGGVYTKQSVFNIPGPSITFSSGASAVNLPSTLGADMTYDITNSMTLPVGQISSFTFGCDFQSSDLSPIPISLESSTVDGTGLVFANPSKKTAGSNDFTVSTSRKKRSLLRIRRATSSLTAIHAVGGITNSGPSTATLSLAVKLNTLSPATGGTLSRADTYLTINGLSYYLTAGSSIFSKPVLTLSKKAQVLDSSVTPAIMRFTVDLAHDAISNSDAYDVTIKGGNSYFDVFWYDGLTGPPYSALTVSQERIYSWPIGNFASGSSKSISYKAKADKKATDLPHGDTWINATVVYKSVASASVTYKAEAGCCVTRVDETKSSLFVNHGFTVMAVIFGILLGLIIVFLVFFIIIKLCRKVPFTSQETNAITTRSHALAAGGGLVTDSRAAKQGVFSAKDVEKSMGSSMTDSIVYIIAQPDMMKVHRELDDRDIKSTIYVDTKLEEERDEAMKAASIHLIMGLKANGDIPSDTVDKCVKSFKKKAADLDKKTEDGFRNELEDAYKRRSAKNRESLADLLSRHQEEDEEMRERTADMDPKERDEIAQLTKKKQETEKNELMYGLKLEQEEETEKIRKEYAIRKRMGLKELQQDTLDDVKKEGKLTEQQADWLIKEYLQNQAGVERIFDEEIARQRMLLEEKLARRRELAQRAEIQEDHQAELLNTMANQVRSTVNKLKKDGSLSQEEAQVLIEQSQQDMLVSKEKMDLEKSRQESDLQQKLSERKRKRMEEVMKRQEMERTDLQKKQKDAQANGYVEPLVLLEEEQKLLSRQRQEMSQTENDIDKEQAEELLQLRDTLVVDAKKAVEASKEKLLDKLHDDGMSEDQANKIISKHKKEMEKLEESHDEEKQKQQKHFEKALKRRRLKYNARREEEQKEQEQLRDQEEQVVRKLMDNQVSLSESERDRILKEHEKQMVKLENSLTLNKLQQKKMLEERLARKRAEQMEKLQKKQQQETKKVTRQLDNDSDMDDEERHHHELDLMKKHAEQSIAILQGEKIEIEDEMEAVKNEMLKERAAALEEQEVKLGAMLAKLQMEKAKEMARIEEQQKAILNLKSNLMDDLNEKGILSNPECQRVIDIHNKDQEKLKNTLDAQRAKQEKKLQSILHKRLNEKEELLQHQQRKELESAVFEEALRKRLQDRLAQKEADLANMQEKQLKDMSAEGNTPAARIRRVALKQKHLLEMEQFRNRMEKEITQTLEEDRRQYDMRRLKDMQNQELQFINGLVRLGKFTMDELENVTAMLFPLKTESERKDLMNQLTEGYKAREDGPLKDKDEVDGPRHDDGTLLERVKSARFERAKSASLRSARGRKTRGTKLASGLKKKRRFLSKVDKEKEELLSQRPDPLGRSNSPDYDSDESRYRRPAPSRLPPLGKKKKTKFDDAGYHRY